MRFIEDHKEFSQVMGRLNKLMVSGGTIERQSFFNNFSHFRFMSFASVFNKHFFKLISQFCKASGDEQIFLLVTDPDPAFYRREFGRYNAVCFSPYDGAESYIEVLNDGPEASSPDSIIDSSNRLIFYADSEAWLIVCDRNSNLSYCSFMSDDAVKYFEKVFEGMLFLSAADAENFSEETADSSVSLLSFK